MTPKTQPGGSSGEQTAPEGAPQDSTSQETCDAVGVLVGKAVEEAPLAAIRGEPATRAGPLHPTNARAPVVENGEANAQCVGKPSARGEREALREKVTSEADRLRREHQGTGGAPKPGRTTRAPSAHLWPEEGQAGAKGGTSPKVVVQPRGEGDGITGGERRPRSLPNLT